ncbi:MBL fold metallo-hydrolase [Actinomadura sp. ATCC 31491]|uniref:MBL fold metallo-hydrolase n=1 Tax=Actinomadura luzonensis TaxID=2805427 RepID=A0ABT0FV40_9ACTN|nr:MBL fold metallo-hydrolase [Actinomadura luzonensis]MCK2215776.1 MBL fold metallo-hydrolase [Actinomadura luzonensis]
MTVHHLNCGTMHPASQRLTNGTGGLLAAATLVCHTLLAETDQGLVLIDTGFGTRDLADPAASLGRRLLRFSRPVLDPEETALRQLARLGHRPDDVRHIVLTHLDPDHAGGLADFPRATVHLHARELEAAERRATRGDRARYRPTQWAHGPAWATYGEAGEDWHGFAAVRPLAGLPPQLALVPLAGHSRGHSGVAVDTGEGWLLHAGDTYFHRGEIDPVRPHCPPGLRLFGNLVQVDGPARRANLARLAELRAAGGDVEVFSAHDPVEYAPHQR